MKKENCICKEKTLSDGLKSNNGLMNIFITSSRHGMMEQSKILQMVPGINPRIDSLIKR